MMDSTPTETPKETDPNKARSEADDGFEDGFGDARPAAGELILDLDGYEGPLDVLLALARDQKVDLTKLSILQLADQYLDFVEQAKRVRLEMAADYLVMAAWLAYLKSRLLLPQTEEGEEPSGAEMAAALRFQLQRLESMREAGETLFGRPQLGQHFYRRGDPEPVKIVATVTWDSSLYDLLRAYGDIQGRAGAQILHIKASNELYSVEDARNRLARVLGSIPEWRTLASFLPDGLRPGLNNRSAIASTFAASLELAKVGKAELRQDGAFGPIYVRGRSNGRADSDSAPSSERDT